MDKISGTIEEKTVSSSNGSTLYKFKVRGSLFSVFENKANSQETKDLLRSLQSGDGVEIEYTQSKNKAGTMTYNNIVSILPVTQVQEGPDSPAPVRSEETKKDRGVALRYAVDAWVGGKIEAGEITTYADQFLTYIKGQPDDEPAF